MAVIIGAAAMAAASVISNTVTNLAQQPVRKQQIASAQLQDRLSQLNSQQQYALALKLQKANSDAEKMQLLTDAVSGIDVATVGGNADILSASIANRSKNSMITAGIIVGSLIALIGAIYFINKD